MSTTPVVTLSLTDKIRVTSSPGTDTLSGHMRLLFVTNVGTRGISRTFDPSRIAAAGGARTERDVAESMLRVSLHFGLARRC